MIALVVDASVGRAASGRAGAGHPSPACSQVMLAVLDDAQFGVATSRAWLEEWNRHATPFSQRWLKQMVGRRRRQNVPEPSWPGIVEVLECAQALPGAVHAEVEKDLHLVELAMVTDRRVLSNDQRQRALLCRLQPFPGSLSELAWVDATSGACGTWLEGGAPCVPPHTLEAALPR